MGVEELGEPAGRTQAIAVVGACVPERHDYARRLAADRALIMVPAARIAEDHRTVDQAVDLVEKAPDSSGLLLEYPMEVPATEIIGGLAEEAGRTELRDLVCVLDAAHLIGDLTAEGFVPLVAERDGEEQVPVYAAQAGLIVTQIEYASTVVLTNCRHLNGEEMGVLTALISHLSPKAHMAISDGDGNVHGPSPRPPFTVEQAGPGWIALLNGDFRPEFRNPAVGALHYEQFRPFHPGRLKELLDYRIGRGEYGVVLRSVGFCHLATRPHITAHWEHVGENLTLSPAAMDHQITEGEDPLALGQDLALIGIGLDAEELLRGLDQAALTDAELLAGPMAWSGFPDPFPEWHTAQR